MLALRGWWLLLLLAALACAAPQNLEIYFIDVEGGAATLVIAPGGQSLLADTGFPGQDDRDARRIHQAATQAGLKRLDYVLITHYHLDHVGGLPALAKLMPIGKFLDHGERVETRPGADAQNFAAYLSLATPDKRLVMKPGQRIPLAGVEAIAVASNGERISQAVNGGGPNAKLCQNAALQDPDPSENARSLGFLLTYGKFQFLDLGDLTWNKEHALACPDNLLGAVDVYQTTHHGSDASGAPQQVWAVRPQVAIMNNGPRKGGSPGFFEVLQKSPGIEDIWQVHRALGADAAHNTAEERIANLDAQCQGHWLKVSVEAGGAYTVTNGRNGLSKTYRAR